MVLVLCVKSADKIRTGFIGQHFWLNMRPKLNADFASQSVNANHVWSRQKYSTVLVRVLPVPLATYTAIFLGLQRNFDEEIESK